MNRTSIESLNKVNEVQLTYSRKTNPSDLPVISDASDCVDLLRKIYEEDPRLIGKLEFIECAVLVLLNPANKAIGYYFLSQGGTTCTLIDTRQVFQSMLLSNATAAIICHNHPSGLAKPSQADIAITKKLVEGGKLLDLCIVDHIILTSDAYYSMADKGEII